jgi:hypothetical protein
MQHAELFVHQMNDLEQLLRNQTTYNALRASAIVRRIILEDVAFLHEMSRWTGEKLSFKINDHVISTSPTINSGTEFVYENIAEGRTRVSIDRFLKQEICFILGKCATVRDLIIFLANKDGGVHFEDVKPDSTAEALQRLSLMAQIDGIGLAYRAMFDVAQAVHVSLLPIYQMLRA